MGAVSGLQSKSFHLSDFPMKISGVFHFYMSVRLTNSDISYDCFYIMRFEWKLHVMYRRPSSSNKSKVSKQTDMWLFTYSPVLTVASTETRVWLPIHQGCRRRQITTSRVNILIPKTIVLY